MRAFGLSMYGKAKALASTAFGRAHSSGWSDGFS